MYSEAEVMAVSETADSCDECQLWSVWQMEIFQKQRDCLMADTLWHLRQKLQLRRCCATLTLDAWKTRLMAWKERAAIAEMKQQARAALLERKKLLTQLKDTKEKLAVAEQTIIDEVKAGKEGVEAEVLRTFDMRQKLVSFALL